MVYEIRVGFKMELRRAPSPPCQETKNVPHKEPFLWPASLRQNVLNLCSLLLLKYHVHHMLTNFSKL